MATTESAPKPKTKKKKALTLILDFRFLSAVLAVVIIAMLLLWRPWEFRPAENARTVSGYGIATVSARPDEFVFSPVYWFMNTNKEAAKKELAAKSDEVIKKLKELGVADGKIKSNNSSPDTYTYDCGDGSYGMGGPDEGNCGIAPRTQQPTEILVLTITIDNETLAQKVQDYLNTTSPEGTVSPSLGFTDRKRKELENQAREIATKDAREQAEMYARDLHFSLGPVKTVDGGAGFNTVYLEGGKSVPADISAGSPTVSTLNLQPGENELRYSVNVTFYIK